MPKVPVPYTAYLRVYEPLAAFPEPERSYWVEYARRERIPDEQDEVRAALGELLAVPPRVAPEQESRDAFVTAVDGVLCVCPWLTRLRAWEALAAAESWAMPGAVLDAALPPGARERAADDYSRWRESNPDARPWIRSALWHVPVRWFVLFADAEREYARRPGGGRLRYRTRMVEARRRLARALRAVRTALPQGPLVPALTDLGRWLEEFHPRSVVELDYGGLVYTISADLLAVDHSAAEVAEALAALADDDLERAGEVYEVLTDRWMAVRERQFAN